MAQSDPRLEVWRTWAHLGRLILSFYGQKSARAHARHTSDRDLAHARAAHSSDASQTRIETWRAWKIALGPHGPREHRNLAHLGARRPRSRAGIHGACGECQLPRVPAVSVGRARRTVARLAHVGGAAVAARARERRRRAAPRWRLDYYCSELACAAAQWHRNSITARAPCCRRLLRLREHVPMGVTRKDWSRPIGIKIVIPPDWGLLVGWGGC